jgi:hypothetical protein
MNPITHISTRLAAAAATAAGIPLAVSSIIQLTDDQSSESTVVGIEHVTLACLTLTVLFLVPTVLELGRRANRAWAARAAVTGQLALAGLTTISNVRGEDPSFFPVVAIASNLLILGGWVALAVALRRNRTMSTVLAVGLPLSWIFALPLSAVGGALVAGAYWLVVGWLLRHERLGEAAGAPQPAPAG